MYGYFPLLHLTADAANGSLDNNIQPHHKSFIPKTGNFLSTVDYKMYQFCSNIAKD